MTKVSYSQLRIARASYYQSIFLCAGIIVGIHAIDFTGHFSYRVPDPFRKYCTIAYFIALIGLCFIITKPRGHYKRILYAWRFEDCPPAIDKSWREYTHALDRAIAPFAKTVAAFVAMTGLKVLDSWFPSLSMLSGFYEPGWWVAVVALGVVPFGFGHRVNEAMQRSRFLEEQLVTSSFSPRGPHADDVSKAPGAQNPVVVRSPLRFNAGNMDWGWEDFYKSCIVLGQPGTGKTVCVLNALLEGLIGSATTRGAPGCSALILDPKGDFANKIRALCRKYGREHDLLVLSSSNPHSSIRWNPLDSPDPEMEIADRFAGVMETLGMKSGDTSFWIDSAKKFIRHSISLLRATNEAGVPPSVVDIARIATSIREIAKRTDLLDVGNESYDDILRFFAEEWCELATETRTSVQAHISNMLDPFLTKPYASLFGGRSTIRLGQVLDRGKILYVDMPIASQPVLARTVGTFLKLEYYNEVLRRLNNPIPSLFLCDEFQAFFTHGQTRGDSDFFDKSRQSNHANVIATQNITGLLKQCQRQEHAEALLGLCQVKIFLRNTDHKTNEYAARLFGESIEQIGGFSGAEAGRGVAGIRGAAMGQQSQGQWGYNVPPERFSELAIPRIRNP